MSKKVIQKIVVEKDKVDVRLDLFVAEKLSLTRSQSQKMIREGLVLVNSEAKSSKYTLKTGDEICFVEGEKSISPDIKIIFEDKNILVVDKPAGITVHPAPGEKGETLSEIFASEYSDSLETNRDMIVHRLDKGTSGVMVLAKNRDARDFLAKQFAARKVNKTYLALVKGKLQPSEGVIDMPLSRDLISRNKIAPADEGKDAKTLYKVEKYFQGYTLVSANPKTGRTHQIRVHFAAIGHPLCGDERYGVKSNFPRMFLHARKLSFISPTDQKRVAFESELPKELNNILNSLTIE